MKKKLYYKKRFLKILWKTISAVEKKKKNHPSCHTSQTRTSLEITPLLRLHLSLSSSPLVAPSWSLTNTLLRFHKATRNLISPSRRHLWNYQKNWWVHEANVLVQKTIAWTGGDSNDKIIGTLSLILFTEIRKPDIWNQIIVEREGSKNYKSVSPPHLISSVSPYTHSFTSKSIFFTWNSGK